MVGKFGIVGVFLLLSSMALHARGETPPPPPFSGGNAGSWFGLGPVFGFDTLGGPGGGWGGGWFGGGWSGWGSGFGGGLLGGGSGSGGGSTGHLFDTTKKDGFGWLHGTCWKETLPGGYWACVCQVIVTKKDMPCDGCPAYGLCAYWAVRNEGCTNIYDLCSGEWHF